MGQCAFYIVDAFTSTPFAGNPCAVVTEADALTDEEMGRISRETNAPETAFVLRSERADVRVRYFMPRAEIPFAGHPTIATGHLLRHLGALPVGTARFEFAVGVLPVEIRENGIVMTQPVATPGVVADTADMAEALGLPVTDLPGELPCRVMRGGVSFMLVPVRNYDVLRRINMDRDKLKKLLRGVHVDAAYVFAPHGIAPETDFHARLIDPANPGEDPFTGSAAGCLAAYAHFHGLCDKKNSLLLEQGHILGRPGTGCLELERPGHKLRSVKLRGTAVLTAEGVIRW